MSLHATNRPADTWFCMSCSQLASGEFCSRRVGGVVCGSLRKFSVGSVGIQSGAIGTDIYCLLGLLRYKNATR